jgi:hypothetical protein
MQNTIKKLVKTIAGQKNTANTVFNQANTEQEFMTLLSQKSYLENYSLLYYTALFFAFISQLATAVSSYTFFADLLAIKLNPTLLPFAVAILLLLIEVLKYVSFNKGLEGVFALPQRINYVLLVFAILLSAGSMYASIIGGGSFGIDTKRIISTETKFDGEIATLRNEIAEIHKRNTWKGSTYLGKKEKKLVYLKEEELSNLKLQKEQSLADAAADNQTAATQYQFGFAFFDALFLLCTLYVWYFRKCVAVEGMVNENVSIAPVVNVVQQPITQQLPTSSNSNSNSSSNPRSNSRLRHQTLKRIRDFGKSNGNQAPTSNRHKPINNAQNMIQKSRESFKKLKTIEKLKHSNTHSDTHSEGSVKVAVPEIVDEFAKTEAKLSLDGNRICEYCKTAFTYKNFKRHYYCSKACCDKASIDRREEKAKIAIAALQEAKPKKRVQLDLFEN